MTRTQNKDRNKVHCKGKEKTQMAKNGPQT